MPLIGGAADCVFRPPDMIRRGRGALTNNRLRRVNIQRAALATGNASAICATSFKNRTRKFFTPAAPDWINPNVRRALPFMPAFSVPADMVDHRPFRVHGRR